ncbi:MAG: AbrB/MazE/SpoVT family DNA-binding domain-containing protein [Candidatus Aenigmarchaeota archaeon]|nr:AbrB/MazE/SpoVT family DNA-binding domain-containing protein [Candidatus Aenigmarchaeota archaeon]
MIELTLKAKKWGNSLAILLPEAVVKEAHIKEGEPVDVLLPGKSTLPLLWGTLKTKRTAEDLKREAAKGWT